PEQLPWSDDPGTAPAACAGGGRAARLPAAHRCAGVGERTVAHRPRRPARLAARLLLAPAPGRGADHVTAVRAEVGEIEGSARRCSPRTSRVSGSRPA